MNTRKRTILCSVMESGGEIERLRLVKQLFLLSQENDQLDRVGLYDFLPYKRGPFSFALYHDLGALHRAGFMGYATHHRLSLTERGKELIAGLQVQFREAINLNIRSYAGIETKALLDQVYDRYPFYTMNSQCVAKRAMPRPKADIRVYTVGYEGLSIDAFLLLLLHNGMERLIDVRKNPVARRYGFHKSSLATNCSRLGIEYLHVPQLGIESSWRASVQTSEERDKLFDRYNTEVLAQGSTSIDCVRTLLEQRPSALMCMEADFSCCHRSHLATRLSLLTGFPIQELRG